MASNELRTKPVRILAEHLEHQMWKVDDSLLLRGPNAFLRQTSASASSQKKPQQLKTRNETNTHFRLHSYFLNASWLRL